MSYVALFSGGKDSNLALWKGIQTGLDIGWLITVKPERDDSYMFHKPNLDLLPKIAGSIGTELIEVKTEGVKEEELKDLESALRSIPVEGVITGAVASNYQRERIEKMADTLEIEVFSPLWNM
ncbi:MAG: diphthine--ammonia ligase, partial [Thermoplasmatota archaeon]